MSALSAMPAAMQVAGAATATAAPASPVAAQPAPQARAAVQLQPATPVQVGAHAASSPGLGGAVVALLLVLALIAAMAWLLKRMPGAALRGADGLRVVASIPLGTRERAAVVQVGGEQVLLGIGAGGVRMLHRLPEPLPAAAPGGSATFPDFRQLLAQRLRKDA